MMETIYIDEDRMLGFEVGCKASEPGLIIGAIDESGLAWEKGVRPGWILTKVEIEGEEFDLESIIRPRCTEIASRRRGWLAMQISALRKHAIFLGIDEDEIDVAYDSDSPKAALVDLVMAFESEGPDLNWAESLQSSFALRPLTLTFNVPRIRSEVGSAGDSRPEWRPVTRPRSSRIYGAADRAVGAGFGSPFPTVIEEETNPASAGSDDGSVLAQPGEGQGKRKKSELDKAPLISETAEELQRQRQEALLKEKLLSEPLSALVRRATKIGVDKAKIDEAVALLDADDMYPGAAGAAVSSHIMDYERRRRRRSKPPPLTPSQWRKVRAMRDQIKQELEEEEEEEETMYGRFAEAEVSELVRTMRALKEKKKEESELAGKERRPSREDSAPPPPPPSPSPFSRGRPGRGPYMRQPATRPAAPPGRPTPPVYDLAAAAESKLAAAESELATIDAEVEMAGTGARPPPEDEGEEDEDDGGPLYQSDSHSKFTDRNEAWYFFDQQIPGSAPQPEAPGQPGPWRRQEPAARSAERAAAGVPHPRWAAPPPPLRATASGAVKKSSGIGSVQPELELGTGGASAFKAPSGVHAPGPEAGLGVQPKPGIPVEKWLNPKKKSIKVKVRSNDLTRKWVGKNNLKWPAPHAPKPLTLDQYHLTADEPWKRDLMAHDVRHVKEYILNTAGMDRLVEDQDIDVYLWGKAGLISFDSVLQLEDESDIEIMTKAKAEEYFRKQGEERDEYLRKQNTELEARRSKHGLPAGSMVQAGGGGYNKRSKRKKRKKRKTKRKSIKRKSTKRTKNRQSIRKRSRRSRRTRRTRRR